MSTTLRCLSQRRPLIRYILTRKVRSPADICGQPIPLILFRFKLSSRSEIQALQYGIDQLVKESQVRDHLASQVYRINIKPSLHIINRHTTKLKVDHQFNARTPYKEALDYDECKKIQCELQSMVKSFYCSRFSRMVDVSILNLNTK